MTSSRAVPCPSCGTQVAWSSANRFRPFCSERCKRIDLGQWATGAYRVPQTEDPDPGEDKEDTRN